MQTKISDYYAMQPRSTVDEEEEVPAAESISSVDWEVLHWGAITYCRCGRTIELGPKTTVNG